MQQIETNLAYRSYNLESKLRKQRASSGTLIPWILAGGCRGLMAKQVIKRDGCCQHMSQIALCTHWHVQNTNVRSAYTLRAMLCHAIVLCFATHTSSGVSLQPDVHWPHSDCSTNSVRSITQTKCKYPFRL